MSSPPQVWTVRKILEWTTAFLTRKEVDSPRLSAELLLAHVLKLPRIRLYTDYERPMVENELAAYREIVRRAGEHEPIAYLTGKAHFFDLELEIKPGVLIPRPDTETLVELVLNLSRHTPGFEQPRILDLCTGSGCVAMAIAKHNPAAILTAVEIDEVPYSVASCNIERLNLASRVALLRGDLYQALQSAADPSPFHLIIGNPPYIPSGHITTLDANVRDYEPMRALDGGPDGLTVHRRILSGAPERLLPNGRVMLEIGYDQGEAAIRLASQYAAFKHAKVFKDAGGNDRVLSLTLA